MAELKECAKLVENVAEQLDARCKTWKETLDRAYKDGKYNQNTGMWETDESKTSRARYALDAYRDALAMVDTLGQKIDEMLRLSAENNPLTCEGCMYSYYDSPGACRTCRRRHTLPDNYVEEDA